jgi:hypothetical protein
MHPFLQQLFPARACAPALDYPFARSDVAMLQRLTGEAPALDGQTWNELLLDQYAAQLARETSIFGQQELHRRLSGGQADPASIARVRRLLDDPAQAASLQRGCQPLRQADTEVSETLFGAALASPPWWSAWLSLVPLALLLAIAASWLVGWPALFAVLVACVVLMTVQVRFYESAKLWERTLATLRHLLKTRAALARLDVPAALPWAAGGAQAARLTRAIERSLLHYVPFIDTLLVEYGDWLLLKNVKRYFRTRQLVTQQLPFLRDSFAQVARLEADLALARQLRASSVFCWAGTAAPRALALRGMLHSLAARHLVIVSSHNLVLGPLLEDCLAPWCVRRDGAGALQLAPGVLQATNGIALLAQRGFDAGIADKAGRVFDWLSTHMAQPADCGGVLERA